MRPQLLLALLVAAAAQPDVPGETVCITINFDDEDSGAISSVTYPDVDGEIGITSSTSYPAIYDTDEPTGNDASDLGNPDARDGIELGKVLIIQEDDPAVMVDDGPDDRSFGGEIYLDFSTFGDSGVVTVSKLTVVDIDSEEEADSYIVLMNPAGEVVGMQTGMMNAGDGSVQEIDFEEIEDVSMMQVIFKGSAAVDDIEVCISESSFSGGPPDVRDDPHVHTADGHVVDIYLKPKHWVSMMAGPRYAISGRVFSKDNDETKQWFDGITLLDSSTGDEIASVVIPHDVEVGSLGDHSEVQYFDVTFEGEQLVKTNREFESKDGLVTIKTSKLAKSARSGIFNDMITIATPDFTFTLESSRETKKEYFNTTEEQIQLTHIDLKFLRTPHPQDYAGPLAEIMFRNIITSKSSEALAWTQKTNALE